MVGCSWAFSHIASSYLLNEGNNGRNSICGRRQKGSFREIGGIHEQWTRMEGARFGGGQNNLIRPNTTNLLIENVPSDPKLRYEICSRKIAQQ